MPMPIQSPEEFNKVLNVSWYHPEKPVDEQVYVYIQVLFTPPVRTGTNFTSSVSHVSCHFRKCIPYVASISVIF